MRDFEKKYRRDVQIELGKVKREIDELKAAFKSKIWTDQKSMVDAANKIWALENRLKDAFEIHKLITDMLEEA